MGLVDRRPVVCRNLAMGFWVPLQENGAPPPSKSSPYAIVYDPRAKMKHIPKVYDAAPLNDHLGELIRAVIFVSIINGCFAKLGALQGFTFFTSIH